MCDADVDKEVSRRSVRAIGKIAFRLPNAASIIIEKLIEFLEIEVRGSKAVGSRSRLKL